MIACDRASVIAQLKQDIAQLKASCLQLAKQPFASTTDLQRLEREVAQARRQYDQALDKRRNQADELEQLIARFQALGAEGVQQLETAPQRQIQHLQAQLTNTAAQLSEAQQVQLEYEDVLQQLKQGHVEFDEQLNATKAALQDQQQQVTKAKARLLQALHARDKAKRDLAKAEQELAAGRASREALRELLTEQAQLHMQPAERSSCTALEQVMQQRVHSQGVAAVSQQRCCWQQDQGPSAGNDAGNCPEAASAFKAVVTAACGEALSSSVAHAVEAASPASKFEPQRQFARSSDSQCNSSATPATVECIQQLLGVTGCSSPQDLLLHVQALQQAAISLEEAAAAAADKPQAAAAVQEPLQQLHPVSDKPCREGLITTHRAAL